MKTDNIIDVTGTTCPMPLIELRKAESTYQKGETILIRGDDPVFESSIRDYCEENAHEICDVVTENRTISITIKL